MANPKRPEFKIEGNTEENFKNFEVRFNDYCIQANMRDLEKDPITEPEEYFKKPLLEISALRSSMPDEALSVIRYTIDPQISTADKNKPWVWMTKLRAHYTGTVDSSLLTCRYKFWNTNQNPHQSVQDWEVTVRQAGSLCAYGELANELCRDKFIFGLLDNNMRAELLKSHRKPDQTQKTLEDVVNEAKAIESATNASKIMQGTLKIEENVNQMSHKDMKLKRQPGTCYWCGDQRGPHPWKICPANGKTCDRCGGNDHFARVCLEPRINTEHNQATEYNSRESTKTQYPIRGQRGRRGNRNQRSTWRGRQDSYRQPKQMNHDVNCTYTDDYVETEDDYCYALEAEAYNVVSNSGKKYFATLSLSTTGSYHKDLQFQIDTAATCNTMSLSTLKTSLPNAKIGRSTCILHPYGNGHPIRPVGQVELVCNMENKYSTLMFQILPDECMKGKPALLSGGDSVDLGLVTIQAKEVFAISTRVKSVSEQNPNKQQSQPGTSPKPSQKIILPQTRRLPPAGQLTKEVILKEYADIFQGLGNIGPPVHFQVDQSVAPVQMPVHRVPVTKRQKEKETLDRYVEKGIIAKVDEPTPWCSNELIRETPNKFRVCIDPSQTINKAILRPVHQMPTLNEQLHKLRSAKCFSLVDAKEGFLQIPLDEESSYLTTMHTSYGRYRWCRLPFGISSAPEEFQLRLSAALEGLDGIINVADDILVYGEGDDFENAKQDHDRRFVALMERCKEKNIKLNPDKLQFKKTEVKFMGFIITDKGIKPDPSKVTAVIEMPTPENKSALLRFIGMVNYLSPFCANLSRIIQPLRALTHDGVPYTWSPAQESAFQKAKSTISSAPVLMYYDVQKPVVLQTDASDIALGGALLQLNKEGKLQPVAFTSCSLSPTEQRYSQIEKECLAICNCFQKFDQWLYGKPNIEVHTDHQPLETIMKKPLNKAPARLQRMLMKLQRYPGIKVTYKKGTSLYIADTLSRAALPAPVEVAVTNFEVFRMELEEEYHSCNNRLYEATEERIREETDKDQALKLLHAQIIQGWPSEKTDVSEGLRPYWSYRDELTTRKGIIYKGHQVLVPQSMHSEMLQKIHVNHFGAESCIRMAREVLFWPGMRKSIQDTCSACAMCAQYGKSAPKEPMMSLPIPSRPWQLVSQDILEHNQQPYLVTVCHFSDWIEMDKLENTLSSTVIAKTKAHFARYGVPSICHTDNGAQFISKEYTDFAREYSFQHTTSSPYHARGNGRAEAAVKVCKSILKKSNDIHSAMLNYRNTPPKGHQYSPAQRMLLRRTRTTLPTTDSLLSPTPIDYNVVVDSITRKRQESKKYYDRSAGPEHSPIEIGSYVYAKPPPHRRGQPWIYGQVMKTQHPRSYSIRTERTQLRRNRIQVKPAAPPTFQSSVLTTPQHLPSTCHSLPSEQPNIPVIPLDACSNGNSPVEEATGQRVDKVPEVLKEPLTRSGRKIRLPERFKDYVLD